MPETTTVVCHDVSIAGNVVKLRFVAEMSLMDGRELEKVGSWSNGSGASFLSPGDSRGVVAKAAGRNMSNWNSRGQDVVTGDCTGKFQVAVGDGALRIVEGDEVLLDRLGERRTPQARLLETSRWMRGDGEGHVGEGWEPNSTHARFSSIHGTIV